MDKERKKENNMNKKKNIKKKKKKRKKRNKKIKYKDMEGTFLHVTVGDKDAPASQSQIENIQNKLETLFEDNNIDCVVFVTHHAVSVNLIERHNNENEKKEKKNSSI